MALTYGDEVTWDGELLTAGLLTKVLKLTNMDSYSNNLQPYGLSPMSGRPMIGKNVGNIMGFEGGTGICIDSATQKYGKKGTILRRGLRLDKRPWVGGQDSIRLRITISFAHTIGSNGAGAEPKVYIRNWQRDAKMPFDETFSSNEAPATEFMQGLGYSAGSATCRVYLAAHDAQGFPDPSIDPFVWDSRDGLVESYVHYKLSDTTFSQGVTYYAMLGPPYERNLFLPCEIWEKHRLNFSDGIVSVYYNNPLGVVQGVGATVEAVGWDTGWHDIEGWHADTTLDPYQIPKPNSYEYPNYPISDPFNPVGEGVG
jgi:hypothetical protein